MIKVCIVDDHELFRKGLSALLSKQTGIEITGNVATGEEVIRLARTSVSFDVVLLDLKMPGIGGLETTKRLLRILPQVKVIMLSAYIDAPFPTRALKAGAMGYMEKNISVELLVDAIRKVYQNTKYVSPDIAQKLALSHVDPKVFQEEAVFNRLTQRELQVMLMITTGQKVQEIAKKLCLSAKTVNTYRYRLFEKLQIKNDVELTHVAMRYGMMQMA